MTQTVSTTSRRGSRIVGVGLVFVLGAVAGAWLTAGAQDKPPATRFFELRTYTSVDGKLDNVNARFRDHTCALFKKHGMELVGFWTPTDEPKSKNTLIYVLAYPSREAREKSWRDFAADPDWKAAKSESEKNGQIVLRPDSVYMQPTDYSPMK